MNNFQSISESLKQQIENEEENIELARKKVELDHEIHKKDNKLSVQMYIFINIYHQWTINLTPGQPLMSE